MKTVTFQVAMSLLYAHYHIFFILIFQQSIHVLLCAKIVKIPEKFESWNNVFAQLKILIFDGSFHISATKVWGLDYSMSCEQK